MDRFSELLRFHCSAFTEGVSLCRGTASTEYYLALIDIIFEQCPNLRSSVTPIQGLMIWLLRWKTCRIYACYWLLEQHTVYCCNAKQLNACAYDKGCILMNQLKIGIYIANG
uniref:Uncharacterized protein n=1 Tax=Romanomermis culicivorax TaxID=13658 RepID=A0A915JD87_ROMCU